jgi:uncharacterized protein (TIGR02594 family)
MTLGKKRRAALLLCSMAMAVTGGGSVFARPAHKAAFRHHATRAAAETQSTDAVRDDRFPFLEQQQAATMATTATSATTAARRVSRRSKVTADAAPAATSFGSSSLVDEARKYVGTNPTGRGSLWCGAFMDMVLKRTGHAGGGNLASGYAHYGTRVDGPQVGAIAVMGRHGGGHVGVVTGIDPSGNPIILSGNHNRTVAESVYPRQRISAYVVPNG